MSDLTERLRKPMNREEFFKVADGLCREAADEIDRLTRELADATRERDAAFAMSMCECGADEACRNLVQARDKALEEAAKVADDASKEWASDAEKWHKDGMLKTAASSLLQSGGADKVAAAIRALKEKP